LERLPGPPPLRFGEPKAQDAIRDAGVLVDALLGTGFAGVPRGDVGEAIEAMNGAGTPIVSIDVPSGVDASTGVVGGAAIRAARTVTFHLGKPGLWIHPGKAHAGEVVRIDIGIPRGAPIVADIGLIDSEALASLPLRISASTKFTSGHVVVVGGSPGLMGAPAMASLAAMRAGAGYVTACVPTSLRGILDVHLMEVMTRGLPDEHGSLTPEAVPHMKEALERAGALALGPGLGRDARTVKFARRLAREANVAMVLDADGLNAHAGSIEELAAREAPTVLTPHAGELARLLDTDSESVQRERLSHARIAAERAQAVVVLKGDDTLAVEPGGRVAVSRGDSPALATAGTGDVLTGAIAALLAQGLEAFEAAALGVQLHTQAGREAACVVGAAEGVIASDVISALPRARRT
jgi:NAD(P)H-hydrate epimerase